MKARMPGTTASLGRSRWMTSSTWGRVLRGFRRMKRRPVFNVALGPLAPTLDIMLSTYGLLITIFAISFWCVFMASNEMPCCASVNMKTEPVSSLGRKPPGIAVNRYPVPATSASSTSMVANRCRSTGFSVRT